MNRLILLRPITVAAICFGVLLNSLSAVAQEAPSGWFGNVYLGGERASFDSRKVFVVSIRVTEAGAQVVDVAVAYGVSSPLPAASADYTLEVVSADGRRLTIQNAPDPRRAIVEKQGNVMLDSGLLSVRLDFNRLGAKVRLQDASGKILVEGDLVSAIDSFCSRNMKDPDCQTTKPPRVTTAGG
jgi:hypothetical protein